MPLTIFLLCIVVSFALNCDFFIAVLSEKIKLTTEAEEFNLNSQPGTRKASAHYQRFILTPM
jgi:hypothetical protein